MTCENDDRARLVELQKAESQKRIALCIAAEMRLLEKATGHMVKNVDVRIADHYSVDSPDLQTVLLGVYIELTKP